MDSTPKHVLRLTEEFWAMFFLLYGCWLTAACFSEDSLLLTVVSLCGFVLLLTGMRYFASRRLKQVLSTSFSLPADQRPGKAHTPRAPTMTEFWLPRTKISFALLLCLAVLFIYLIGEVTIEWGASLLGAAAMLVLYFAQAKPDFRPFRWRALMILPLAALTSSALGIPVCARAPITSISFGMALLCSAVIAAPTFAATSSKRH